MKLSMKQVALEMVSRWNLWSVTTEPQHQEWREKSCKSNATKHIMLLTSNIVKWWRTWGGRKPDVNTSHVVKYWLMFNHFSVLFLCKLAQKVITVISQNTKWNMMCFEGYQVIAEPKCAKKKQRRSKAWMYKETDGLQKRGKRVRLPIQVYLKSVNII